MTHYQPQYRNPHLSLSLLLSLILLTSACTQIPLPAPAPTDTATPTPTEAPQIKGEPLYLSIIWHQHQPIYFKDPESNVYQKPWVRLHAAKDYVDMAAILDEYPDIRATYNLTPSLLRQLLDLESGTKDLYQIHTEIPAADLTDDQKTFIVSRFFDINPKIITRFPRYQEIANDRENSDAWDESTWRDLQLLFNLGWTDPTFLAQEPLARLVEKGRNFSEEEKAIVLAEHLRLISEVIPLHKRLQDAGQIEITTTPFFHPILPLLVDSNLAGRAVDDIELPARYTFGLDAVEQVRLGVAFYRELFGQAPRGMWPAEGAVAQEVVGMIAKTGIDWIATDEEVLARSIGQTGFGRNAQETVQEADALYRPYIAKGGRSGQLYVLFRDKVISDKVGFTYSGEDGEAAARDLISRLHAIREQLAGGGSLNQPYLVSIILDGENAWEHYPNDGKKFLHALYRLLEEEQSNGTIRTITPSHFIDRFPQQPQIEELWAGSWVSPDYLTWIGEAEENRAWNYLHRTRNFVLQEQRKLDETTLAAVMDAIYTAEGSDWFWWYGSDQNSGDDASFDEQFRRTLQRVYRLMEKPIPDFLKVPVIPAIAQQPDGGVTALISPDIDGIADVAEWEGAGFYTEEGGTQATAEQVVDRLYYGFDSENVYLRLDSRRPWRDIAPEVRIGFYLTQPGGRYEQPFTRISLLEDRAETLLGFGANMLFEVVIVDLAPPFIYRVDGKGNYQSVQEQVQSASQGSVLEIALPYSVFGKPDAGDQFRLRAVVSEGNQRDIQLVPGTGSAQISVPDLGLTTPILTITDPVGDDHGPGSYTYPQDGVFGSGAYDLTEFAWAEDESNYIFRFTFAGKLNNSWGAPNGMGIHTLDIYIDAIEGRGERRLLPGRNAALPEGSGWDLAIWAEGWTPALYTPPTETDPTPQKLGGSEAFQVISDAGNNKITIRIAKETVADALQLDIAALEPASWGILATVASQEGFPAGGVWRIRDVEASAQQWRLGGAPADTNHTRLIDVAYPANFSPSQEEALSSYPPSQAGSMDELGADDFAQLEGFRKRN